ncbi:MAG: RNA 3'-terminal phosphate cyclase [Zavarzinia sp.]|nr:RNA 3'-terminal phosphate cyclase [Zavarzinia sp.]
MIIIDGTAGEGGGQILRSSLALSLVMGEAFRIENIRAGRPKPGLMRQHVTAVEAACAVGGATCDGLALGARDITFRPGRITPGDHHFAIGTAGSTSLVLQTVLPALMMAAAPSRLVIEGGTHNPAAPPFEFLERCFLPRLARFGPQVTARLIRHGFFPAGGGRIEVEIEPAPLRPVDFGGRGPLRGLVGTVLIAGLPGGIARREIETASTAPGLPGATWHLRILPPDLGPGNTLSIEALFDDGSEIVTGFAERGLGAEALARVAARRMAGFLETGAWAGPHLADQLLLPLALAGGGGFTTVAPSGHGLTNAEVIHRFTGRRIVFTPQADGTHGVALA